MTNAKNSAGSSKWAIRLPFMCILIVLALMPENGAGFSICPSQLIFSTPCPACGITRSVGALLKAQPQLSWHYHPLGWLVLVWLLWGVLSNRSILIPADGAHSEHWNRHGRVFFVLIVLFLALWIVRVWILGIRI